MKILIFSWRDMKHPFAGGSELNLFSQASYWIQWGQSVTVFTARFGNAKKHEVVDGIDIFRRGNRYTVYLWAVMYYFWKLRQKADVILDILNVIPFFTPLYSRKKKIVLVHHISSEQIDKELPYPLNKLATFLQNRIFPFIYRKTKMISVSESTQHALLKIGLQKNAITVIHNGVNHTKLYPTEKKTPFPSIIYLGRLKKYKRIEILIDIFPQVQDVYPQAQISIVGSGDEDEILKQMVKKKGLSDHIFFTGFVSENNKTHLLSKSWVFITPSLVEGWGLSVIEANACGTPTIAFDVPGLENSIQNGRTGYLVHDKKELLEKTLLLLNNKTLREKMSQAAIDWAKQFDWEKSAEATLQQLNTVQ